MAYFTGTAVATNYAASRPYFHPVVINHIRERLGFSPVPRALDVACGTGQSTRALAELADSVVGTDQSLDMLAAAERHPRVRYLAARAEEQPFAAGSFQLLTVALAFHWFDQARFLAEARRLLAPGGRLVIYNNAFRAVMHGNPAFKEWFTGPYLARYPSPPRHGRPLGDDDAAAAGFRFVARQDYDNDVEFTQVELTRYLMSQTNVIAVLQAGGSTPAATRDWLDRELAPLFRHESERVLFGGPIWYLERT